MNRHHPYGGHDTPRRGGHHGAGPDRTQRFGSRGGRGGGRGGYHEAYGQTQPSYNNYDPYANYQAAPPQSQEPYANGYGNYNDEHSSYGAGADTGPEDNQYGFDGSARKRPLPRKVRDDKVHDSLIEERIQRERPCRTLFIRNIKYETESSYVRRQFEEHGEIKTFFDLIANRGMVFVTYYDLRAAERAREHLQGSEIGGRPIDVHYSLPRGDEQAAECDREKNQGTLLVTLRSPSRQPVDDAEVRRKIQQFGDVKTVKMFGNRIDQRFVELYDVRACALAHDRLQHQSLQDGTMEVEFAWDVPDHPLPSGSSSPGKKAESDRFKHDEPHPRGARGRGRGGRGRNARGGHERDRDFPGRDHDDVARDRDSWGRERRFDDAGFNGSPRSNRFNGERDRAYTPPLPPLPNPSGDDRLEQAMKVQKLLEALQQPQPPPPVTPTMPLPPPSGPSGPYYPPAPGGQPPYTSPPLPNSYAPYQPPPGAFGPIGAATTPTTPGATLPPNIITLLQQAQQVQSQSPTSGPAQPPHQSTLSQAQASSSSPLAAIPPAQYQQFLAFLAQQQGQQKQT